MARPAELEPEVPADGLTLKQQGAQTVQALTKVSAQLFPLKEKARAGLRLTRKERKLLDELDTRYRQLEGLLRQLMRPRDNAPWLRGADHGHGPEHPRS
jgi:hypothetical protein